MFNLYAEIRHQDKCCKTYSTLEKNLESMAVWPLMLVGLIKLSPRRTLELRSYVCRVTPVYQYKEATFVAKLTHFWGDQIGSTLSLRRPHATTGRTLCTSGLFALLNCCHRSAGDVRRFCSAA